VRRGSSATKSNRQTCGSGVHPDTEASSLSSVVEPSAPSWSTPSASEELPASDGVSPSDELPEDGVATYQGHVLKSRIPIKQFTHSPDPNQTPD